jgi:hypothetical protein
MATPNMNLTLPVVGVTPGPTYATQNNAAFTTIDAHDHSAGKGAPISTSGLSYTAPFTGGVARSQTGKFSETLSIQDFGGKADGVTDSTSALSAAQTIALSTGQAIFFPGGVGAYLINAGTLSSVSNGVTLRFDDGAVINIVTGTLAIQGAIEAGLHQIFGTGTVDISLAKVPYVFPEWFGAVGNYNPTLISGSDDHAAFNTMFSSMGQGQTAYLSSGYGINGTITTKATVNITGPGALISMFSSDTTSTLLQLGPNSGTGATNCRLTQFRILGGPSCGKNAINCYYATYVYLDIEITGGFTNGWNVDSSGAGGVEDSTIHIVSFPQYSSNPWGFTPSKTTNVFNVNGWVNGSAVRIDSGGATNGIKVTGTLTPSNDSVFSGSIQGSSGWAVDINTGTQTRLENLHCETGGASGNDIRLTSVSYAQFSGPISGGVTLVGSPYAKLETLNGTLNADANSTMPVLEGRIVSSSDPISSSASTSIVSLMPPDQTIPGDLYATSGITLGTDVNLVLNGDFQRFVGSSPGANILWGWAGNDTITKVTSTNITRNSPVAVSLAAGMSDSTISQVIYPSGALPSEMLGRWITISAKIKQHTSGTFYVNMLPANDSSYAYGALISGTGISVENGFSLVYRTFRITSAMVSNGIIIRFTVGSGTWYLSEVMAVHGHAAPREFIRSSYTRDGTGKLEFGKLITTAAPSSGIPSTPAGSDPYFSQAWQVGDIIFNTAPSELGTTSSKYVVNSIVCTSSGSPGTWLQMRTLTGN